MILTCIARPRCGSLLAAPLVLVLFQPASFIALISFLGAVFGVRRRSLLFSHFKEREKHGTRTPEYQLKVPSVILYVLMALFACSVSCIHYLME